MDGYLGTIMPFAGNFAPRGWAMCNGQTLSIQTYTALFALLGTAFGGDGKTNFGLPNLNGRAIVGAGQLAGGGNYVVGQAGGAEHVNLSTNQLPAHTHTLQAEGATAGSVGPGGNLLARSAGPYIYGAPGGNTVAMAPSAISSVGGGQPVPTTTPYQCVNYIICVEGMFPARN